MHPVGVEAPTRRDARENRERVLAAAVSTMLRDGRQVPMSVIAAEAGVGVATLYRRYPNRDALLMALTERAFGLLADLAEAATDTGGSGLAQLERYWDVLVDEADQLVLPLHGGPAELSDTAVTQRQRLHRALRRILRTGRTDGSIRDDITLTDLIYFGAMLVQPVRGGLDWQRVARRQRDIHLAGIASKNSG